MEKENTAGEEYSAVEEGDRYIMDNKLELSLLKRRGAKAMGSVCVHFESHGLCAVAFSGNVATQHE